MSNGDDALKILVKEADGYIAQEGNMDFSKCAVSPVMPKATLLILKIQAEQLRDKIETPDNNKTKIKIPTPFGKAIELEGRDSYRIMAIVAMAFIIWMLYTDKDERRQVKDDLKAWHTEHVSGTAQIVPFKKEAQQ